MSANFLCSQAVAALSRLFTLGYFDDEIQAQSTSTESGRAPSPITVVLADLVHRSYRLSDATGRKLIRECIGDWLIRVGENCSGSQPNTLENERSLEGATVSLRVLRAIIAGFETPLSRSNQGLLVYVILPLHRIRGKRSPSEPMIGLVHRELVLCACTLLEKAPEQIGSCIKVLLEAWPTHRDGNSPKQVLLLHELEAILALENPRKCLSAHILVAVAAKIAECIGSDNSTICERALRFWRNEDVVAFLFEGDNRDEVGARVCKLVLPPILQSALSHWNKTVVRMAAAVLSYLYNHHESVVLELARATCPSHADDIKSHLKALQARQYDDPEAASATSTSSSQGVSQSGDPNATLSSAKKTDAAKAVVPSKQDTSFMNMILAEEIGHGSFSHVFRAFKVERGKPRSEWKIYALKRINVKHRELAIREGEMMDRVCHPNCTRLIGIYESGESLNLVVEYAKLGDLHSLVTATGGTLDEDTARFVAAEVAAGLAAVHEQSLVFGDLKPENILVHANGHVKLGDFGATRDFSQVNVGEAPLEGTLCYLAPELFQRSRDAAAFQDQGDKVGDGRLHFPAAIDWWSFGGLLFHMLTGRPPLWAEEEQDLVRSLVSFKIEKYPDGFPESAANLVDQLLVRDPAQRLGSLDGVSQIETHPFFLPLGCALANVHQLPAPKFKQGQVKVQNGPWTQRTYSMMIAPLPKQYETGGALAAIPESSEDRDLAWKSAQGLSKGRGGIGTGVSPQGRFPPVRGQQDFHTMAVMPGTSARRPSRGNGKYSVKGLDLTAG